MRPAWMWQGQVWFVCRISFHSICLCFCLHLWPPRCRSPICPALPLCCPAIQHIKEPWLVQSIRRPPVSFTPGPNEKCPLSFSLPPFEVLPSTGERGRAGLALKPVTQHSALLSMLHFIKKDTDALKGSGALTPFVCHGSLCFCVGVRDHGCK